MHCGRARGRQRARADLDRAGENRSWLDRYRRTGATDAVNGKEFRFMARAFSFTGDHGEAVDLRDQWVALGGGCELRFPARFESRARQRNSDSRSETRHPFRATGGTQRLARLCGKGVAQETVA